VEDIGVPELIARDGDGCAFCGAVCESYEVEHVWALSRDGLHNPPNLVLACLTCNRSKYASDPLRWAAKRFTTDLRYIPSPAVLEAIRIGYSAAERHMVIKINGEIVLAA